MSTRWVAIVIALLIVGIIVAGAWVGYLLIQERGAVSSPVALPTATTSLVSAGLPTPASPTPLPEGAVVIPDTTKVLTGTTTHNLASISADGATFTFSETTAQLEELSQGDVIVGGVSEAAR